MNNTLIEFVPSVYRFALRLTGDRHLAEDVVQETFLRACRRLGRLRDEHAMRTWLFRIAVNAFRDEVRKAGRRPQLRLASEERLVDVSDAGKSPSTGLAAREHVTWIVSEMDALPERQRQIFYLSAFEELSHGEISDVLRINVSAVKATLSLARKKLRGRLAARDKATGRRS